MERRNFLRSTVAASAASVAALVKVASDKMRSNDPDSGAITYEVSGFTCVTCAVGLEVMLKGLHGVRGATASYPDNQVTIDFDRTVLHEPMLKEFVLKCGFSIS